METSSFMDLPEKPNRPDENDLYIYASIVFINKICKKLIHVNKTEILKKGQGSTALSFHLYGQGGVYNIK